MNITCNSIDKTCPEPEIYESVLTLDNKKILELGCGTARITRLIATIGKGRIITATEVDKIQHKKNTLINDLPNVEFKLGGGENIQASDNTFDIVFMFKSLHHVPLALMGNVLQEIRRVLKPGGLLYISEPIFKGDFNQILKLFHNEEVVRQKAFDAIKRAIDTETFTLVDEIFFNSPSIYENFEQFEEIIIKVTHTDHHLPDELYTKVKEKFAYYFQQNNGHFLSPIRVDILRK
jgi:ubiquinone/menaquinone biosynthesis C-methylase UbiE